MSHVCVQSPLGPYHIISKPVDKYNFMHMIRAASNGITRMPWHSIDMLATSSFA